MKTIITIEIEGNEMTICEQNCCEETYQISEDSPAMIDDVCEYLHDYLEGM